MFGITLRFVICVIVLGALAVVTIGLRTIQPQLFNLQKLELAASLKDSVPVSSILPENVASICVLGSYSSVRNQLAESDIELSKQIDPSVVDENYVRVATFNGQSEIISENDLPRGRGQVRINADGIKGAFCQDAEVVMVKIVKQDRFTTVQFIR